MIFSQSHVFSTHVEILISAIVQLCTLCAPLTVLYINLIGVFTFVQKANALQGSDWSHAVGGGGEAPLVRTPTPDTTNHSDGDGDVDGGDNGGDGEEDVIQYILLKPLVLLFFPGFSFYCKIRQCDQG